MHTWKKFSMGGGPFPSFVSASVAGGISALLDHQDEKKNLGLTGFLDMTLTA